MKVYMTIKCYGTTWGLNYGKTILTQYQLQCLETIRVYNLGNGDRGFGVRGVCNHWKGR